MKVQVESRADNDGVVVLCNAPPGLYKVIGGVWKDRIILVVGRSLPNKTWVDLKDLDSWGRDIPDNDVYAVKWYGKVTFEESHDE
jgi:hypothetical protein